MVEQSLNHLPKSLKQVFIIRKDMSGVNSIKRELEKKVPEFEHSYYRWNH